MKNPTSDTPAGAPGLLKPSYLHGCENSYASIRGDMKATRVEYRPHQNLSSNRRVRTGNPRGKILGFSPAACHRLRSYGDSIAWGLVPLICIELVYPSVYPQSSTVWKRHLQAFRAAFERRYGPHGMIWKLEQQARGAPHWHLILLATSLIAGALPEFRAWVAHVWPNICESDDAMHRRAGTTVKLWRKRPYGPPHPLCYLAKPVQQFIDPETGVPIDVGRYWGSWSKERIPVEWVEVRMSEKAAIRCYRVLRRYFKRRCSGRFYKITGQLSSRSVERLLAWANSHT